MLKTNPQNLYWCTPQPIILHDEIIKNTNTLIVPDTIVSLPKIVLFYPLSHFFLSFWRLFAPIFPMHQMRQAPQSMKHSLSETTTVILWSSQCVEEVGLLRTLEEGLVLPYKNVWGETVPFSCLWKLWRKWSLKLLQPSYYHFRNTDLWCMIKRRDTKSQDH